ncbi:hypothetical protein WL42_26070 [Burkholderia ubonensis]|nr:hypothetical protein WL42_26070 [Burkholderia ubonensis]
MFATERLSLMFLCCSCRMFSAITPSPPNQPLREGVELLALVGRRLDRATQFRIIKILQQE